MMKSDNLMQEEFASMCAVAREALSKDADAQQALVLMTSDGKTYTSTLHHITEGSHEEEKLFLNHLEDVNALSKVVRIVCMWQDGALDIPSAYFRATLRQNVPNLKNVCILLCGGNCNLVKTLDMIG